MRRAHLAIAVVCLTFLGLRSRNVYAQASQSRPAMWAPKLSGPNPGEYSSSGPGQSVGADRAGAHHRAGRR